VAPDVGGEVARFAFQLLEFGQRKDFDVLVAAGLNQLRRQDAHRAVVGGEGLVELGHRPADGGALLDEVYLDAGVGQVERGLDTGDAAAYHHGGSHDVVTFLFFGHLLLPSSF
jgi:hypothetical protein